ncbi:MAG TPA: signal peptide peptidase SppA [Lacipirellulaceae bacterium]|jgi:protease-4
MAGDAVNPGSAQIPRAPAATSPPQQIIIQQPPRKSRWFGKLLTTALVVALLIIYGMYGSYRSYYGLAELPKEKYHSLSKTAQQKIAIINVEGLITETDGYVKKQIECVKNDPDVVGVVLRIDSPGGTVTGSDYIYHHLRKLAEDRKVPIVVSMGGICASGGYYIAMSVGGQKDAIFAEPTTWTGSIGVIIPHYDLSGLLGRFNVSDDSIASGPLKQMGSPTRPITPEERKLLQQLVDDTFAGFKQIVASGRPKFKDDPGGLDAVATGQIFTAKQALDHGLVDKLGFIEDAIARDAELANTTIDQVRCVKYEASNSLLSEFMNSRAPLGGAGLDVTALLDLTTPRAYYLWTFLPSALSNSRGQ